jgi:hypothetical protein
MEQTHAYIYFYEGKAILIENFSKDIIHRGHRTGTTAVAKVTKDFKMKSQYNGRICIHTGEALLIDIIKSAKIDSVRIYGEQEVAFVGKKGSIVPRASSANFTYEANYSNLKESFESISNLERGDRLFGYYDDPVVIQVK